MARKRYSVEQIIAKVREAELLVSKGGSVAQACKKIAVTEQTYYRWRKESGGLRFRSTRSRAHPPGLFLLPGQ